VAFISRSTFIYPHFFIGNVTNQPVNRFYVNIVLYCIVASTAEWCIALRILTRTLLSHDQWNYQEYVFFTSSIVLHSSCMMMAVPCIQRSITIVSQHSICSCSSLFSISNSPRLNYFTSISANCNYAFQTDIAVLLQLMIGICEQMMWAIRD